jgi:DDE superfamily endonuclease
VVGFRLAAHQKKARRQHAHIALIDESGLRMAPLVRRTWALRGQTPNLVQRGQGTREKVSVAAALWLSPRRDRLGLYFKTLVNGYFNNWQMTAFLEAMMQDLEGRFLVVWDGGGMHKGDPIHQLIDHFADRLCLEALPPWAPMLNPTEPLWSWLKYDRLCNYGPFNAAELNQRVLNELARVEDDQQFLRSLYHASELPLPRALFI